MLRTQVPFWILRLPVLELLVAVIGLTGLAEVLDNAASRSADWWNTMFIVCGILSAAMSLICDVFLPRFRKATSLISAVVGVVLVAMVVNDQDGPDIGGIFVLAIGATLIVSAVLRSLRGGVAYVLDRNVARPEG